MRANVCTHHNVFWHTPPFLNLPTNFFHAATTVIMKRMKSTVLNNIDLFFVFFTNKYSSTPLNLNRKHENFVQITQ